MGAQQPKWYYSYSYLSRRDEERQSRLIFSKNQASKAKNLLPFLKYCTVIIAMTSEPCLINSSISLIFFSGSISHDQSCTQNASQQGRQSCPIEVCMIVVVVCVPSELLGARMLVGFFRVKHSLSPSCSRLLTKIWPPSTFPPSTSTNLLTADIIEWFRRKIS